MGRAAQALRRRKLARVAVIGAGLLLLAGCASSNKHARKVDPRYGVSASPRVVEYGEPVPKGGGTYRVGRPYTVAGQVYVPEEDRQYRAEGVASWYGDDFHGRMTANGEVFDMDGISAAHPTLPMPSYARVTNLRNGRSLVVRVNDRGPYHGNRLIDVSTKAAHLLGFRQHGTARVRVEYVGQAPLEGSDDRVLAATLREGGPAPAPSSVMVASARPFVPDAGPTAADTRPFVSDTRPFAADARPRGPEPRPFRPEFDNRRLLDVPAPESRPFDRPYARDRAMSSEHRQGGEERATDPRASDRGDIRAEPLGPPPGPAPSRSLAASPMRPEPPAARPRDGIASFISGRGLY